MTTTTTENEHNDLLTAILESAVEGLLVVDTQGRVLHLNARFARMWRIPEDLLAARDDKRLLTHVCDQLEDPDAFIQRVHELYQSDREEKEELLRFKDGRVFERRSIPLMRNGNVGGRIWHFLDITRRERAERKRRESDERFQAAFNSLLLGMILTTAKGRFLKVNTALTEMLGYAESELLGCQFADLVPVDDRARALSIVREFLTDDSAHAEFESRFARKDKLLLWAQVSLARIDDDDGRLRYLVAQIQDITERKRAERERDQGRAQLQELIDNLPEGICLLAPDQRVVRSNPTAQKYLRLLSDAGPERPLSHLAGQTIDTVLSPQSGRMPHRLTTQEPPPRIIEIHSSARNTGGWVLLMRDVTDEQTRREQDETQNRLASVGQLAAGIAHDFNNLLTVMNGYAQMLEMRADVPKDAKRDLVRIFEQGERAAQLVRQILDFSRQSEAEYRPVNLVPFIKETAKMLSRTLPETVRVRTDIAPGEHIVEGDLTQLHQVFTNLAVNAQQAMPDGGELHIGLSKVSLAKGTPPPIPDMPPGDWIVWTVSDTGTGIPDDVVQHIFEPFFTTKKPGEGTGLGLAQTYGIVQQHGGLIDVKTQAGNGTTFTLYLPAIHKRASDSTSPLDAPPRGSGETVLVVEDEEDVRSVTEIMLKGLNYRVVTAENGEEALDRLAQEQVDLVLSDVVMPVKTGLELRRDLKERFPDLPVILMTGYEAEATYNFPKDIAAVLHKPIPVRNLAQSVHVALSGDG